MRKKESEEDERRKRRCEGQNGKKKELKDGEKKGNVEKWMRDMEELGEGAKE